MKVKFTLFSGNKVISKREIFGKIDLIRITDPEGGAFWETRNNQQDIDINNAKANFMPISEEILNIKPNFWWVCQGDSYTEERGHKFIWAPHKDKSGKSQYHWDNVRKVKKGDIIFNYANGAIQGISIAESVGYDFINDQSKYEKEGTRVDIEHYKLESLQASDIKLKKTLFEKVLAHLSGPFDINGDVKQGYLFELNFNAAKIIREIYGKPFPDPIEKLFSQEKTIMTVRVQIPDRNSGVVPISPSAGLPNL